jgi:hypothetical protein
MPPDPYCASGNRYRRHSRYVLLPWLDLLEPRPTAQYFQDRELNPTDGGMTRSFERLTKPMEANAFLRAMILFDFFNTPFDEELWSIPVDVGIHAIRYVARPGLPAISSPNKLHKNGERFTFVHLIERRGIAGRVNVVADNDKQLLVRLTLVESLDTVTISDKDVCHQVESVEVAPGETEGYRDVLLIDFTPMHPVLLRAPELMLPTYDSPRAEPIPQPESSTQKHPICVERQGLDAAKRVH